MAPRPANRPSAEAVMHRAREMLTAALLRMRLNDENEEGNNDDPEVLTSLSSVGHNVGNVEVDSNMTAILEENKRLRELVVTLKQQQYS